MRIRTLNLGDFGCFDRARIDDLEDGVTVIAGPQRAGKTTFMNAVRCLGYGVPRNGSVPPASTRYDLSADVVVSGEQYRLSIDGHATPELTTLNGAPNRDLSDVFGGLSSTHYQQLYTISLDELSRLPDSLDDDAKLSEILLSAAYGDIHHVPDVRDAFAADAKAIGGKHASARGVYEMKEPMKRIQAGIDDRNAAIAQVDEHASVSRERDEVITRIEGLEREIDKRETEQKRLETVVSCYDDYDRLREVESKLEALDVEPEQADRFPLDRLDDVRRLQEAYEERLEDVRAEEDEFEAAVGVDQPNEYLERLLENRDRLREFQSQLSGWRERVRSVRETTGTLREREGQLERDVQNLHSAWTGDVERVVDIDTDVISGERLRAAVETSRSANDEVQDLTGEVDELETRRDELEARIDGANPTVADSPLAGQYPVAIGGAVLGLLVGLVVGFAAGPIAGVLVTSIVYAATGTYVVSQIDVEPVESDGVSIDALNTELEKVESQLAGRRDRLETQREKAAEADQTLDELKSQLDLPDDVPARAAETFYDDLVELQDEFRKLSDDRQALAERRATLSDELEAVATTLVEVSARESVPDDPVDEAESLFATVERVTDQLDVAEDAAEARRSLNRVETDFRTQLETWDDCPTIESDDRASVDQAATAFIERGETVDEFVTNREVRETLRETLRSRLTPSTVEPTLKLYRDPSDGDEWHLDAYARILAEFDDVDAIEARLDDLETTLDELRTERNEAVERRIELERELEDLASDDDVRGAYATIETGRKRLEPLAEEYATLRIAESLLDELHERFIERTTGPLLDDASEILERITGSTYTQIDSTDEFDRIDFEAERSDGTVHRSAQLSRATAEQLFLAIRLARIRRHSEPLPVLLDDSLTNFDPVHVERTLHAIGELATETQVFVLTCHPSMLELLESATDATYWCLDDGQFDGPHTDSSAACHHLQQSTSY